MNAFLRLLILLASLSFTATAAAAGTLLVFGDSLSAGYGIRQEAAWPSLLQKRLAEKRVDYSVVNASISGETTAGGRSRIAEAIGRQRPSIVIIALGANDGLRGLPVPAMKENLTAMIRAARTAKARVVLVGMRLPPNYGPYADEFHKAYAELARSEKVALVPFLLDGIADQPRLFQSDTIHPTAEAQPKLLDNVWVALAPLLK
ncbi:MAG: arylesterase [Rhodocyclaceae bacterium]|jgi:acyl-CoA thioesterase-1|nr:MAG: arylesterase [Rhodocyclaceae bacterium]